MTEAFRDVPAQFLDVNVCDEPLCQAAGTSIDVPLEFTVSEDGAFTDTRLPLRAYGVFHETLEAKTTQTLCGTTTSREQMFAKFADTLVFARWRNGEVLFRTATAGVRGGGVEADQGDHRGVPERATGRRGDLAHRIAGDRDEDALPGLRPPHGRDAAVPEDDHRRGRRIRRGDGDLERGGDGVRRESRPAQRDGFSLGFDDELRNALGADDGFVRR